MEIQEQDDQHLRYDRKEYSSQQAEHLIAELEAFRKSKAYEFLLNDLHVEIADLTEQLGNELLDMTQVNILRGRINQAKEFIFRIKDMQDFLEAAERNRNQENDE